nr:ABC transporter ATP-binding protein [uncultured Sphingomonas sp.]
MSALVASNIALPPRLFSTSFTANAGEMIAVIGPNGGGKTSLLRSLARVESSAGSVLVNDRNVDSAGEAERRRLLSYLPSSRDIRWPISVFDLIGLGFGRPEPDCVQLLIDQFELHDLANRPSDSLSTGERARVLMARAVAADPTLLLLDEPLSNLDPYWVLRFIDLFRDAASRGRIVLVALHDLAHLPRFDRAILVAGGKVQIDETPADILVSERFEDIFRVRKAEAGWQLIPPADPQSSQ